MTVDMHTILTTLIDRLDSRVPSGAEVIMWGCPVPSFGDLNTARVATLGLNPSNREFVDERGEELQGISRRFHTLRSLGLRTWAEADARHLRLILDSCSFYFCRNPYDTWFRRLDQLVNGTGASFYDSERSACHLDLIPYATTRKWTDLSQRQRAALFATAADALALLLKDSSVRMLILNGQSVVDHFKTIAGAGLEPTEMSEWALPRMSKPDILGIAYRGTVTSLAGVSLSHSIVVLGYNHNLQSSFGVTNHVVTAIQSWIAKSAKEIGL